MSRGLIKPKRRLSSLDVAVLTRELSTSIRESHIDNVYSVEGRPNALILKLRLSGGDTTFLYVEGGVRVNLTHYVGGRSSSHSAPLFRRFLRNSRVANVRQHEFERIVLMDVVMPRSVSGSLVAELIPRGVVALLDEGRRTLATTSNISTKDRVVRAGLPYRPPPQLPNPFKLSAEEWASLLTSGGRKLGSTLVRVLGIPPEVVNEVLDESLRSAKTTQVGNEVIASVRRSLLSFMNDVIERPQPVIVECGGTPLAFYPFKPKSLPKDCVEVSFSTFNEAVDEYFAYLESVREAESLKKAVTPEVSQLRRALDKAVASAESLRQRVAELEKLAGVFERNYRVLEDIWRCVRGAVKARGWEVVRELCRVSGVNPHSGVFTAVLDGVEVKLSVKEDFHKQYISLRKELGRVRKKLCRAEDAIKDLRGRLESEDRRVRAELLKKPVFLKYEWFMQYRWVITSEGYLAIGGRDAQQNEKVVRKYLGDNDIFLHAEIHGAPAFVVKCGGKVPSRESLLEVATLAVSYSRGWREGVGALDAFWVWGRQVSKSPPPGEYLPKGSFMIYGRRNYIRGVKLELSIGIEVIDDKYYRLAAGPESLVRSRCACYVTLTPGNRGAGSLAKEIVDYFKRCSNYSFVGLDTSLVQQVLPGPSRILKKLSLGKGRIT